MKKILIVTGIVSLAVVAYFLVDPNPKSKLQNPGPETQTPHSEFRTPHSRHVAAEGKVETMPGLDVEVGSELTGKIEKFFVNEADPIIKGTLIARLWNKDIEARLKEAELELIVAKAKLREVESGAREEEIKRAAATLDGTIVDMDLTKKNFERYEELYKEGVIPKALLDEKESLFKIAITRVREAAEEKRLLEKGPKEETIWLLEDSVMRAEASVEYYKKLLEKTLIIAPISGKVIHKYLEEGEIASEDIPLVAIADVERIRINAEVDETDADRVHVGDHADITSDGYPGKVFKGEIQEISDYVGVREVRPNNPAKNLDRKVLRVKIGLSEKTPLKLGMTVDVKIMAKNISTVPGD